MSQQDRPDDGAPAEQPPATRTLIPDQHVAVIGLGYVGLPLAIGLAQVRRTVGHTNPPGASRKPCGIRISDGGRRRLGQPQGFQEAVKGRSRPDRAASATTMIG